MMPDPDESLEDKLAILKATPFSMPSGCLPLPSWNIPGEREAFIAKLAEELPCFIAELLVWKTEDDPEIRRSNGKSFWTIIDMRLSATLTPGVSVPASPLGAGHQGIFNSLFDLFCHTLNGICCPGRPGDEVAPGTLNSILKQAGLK